MKLGVKPTPSSFKIARARALLAAVLLLLTASNPASVTDSTPRKIDRSPHSFHISIRCGNLQMMSVRVCTVKYFLIPAALILRAGADRHGVDRGMEEPRRLARGVVPADQDEGLRQLAPHPLGQAERAVALGGEVALQAHQVRREFDAAGHPRLLAVQAQVEDP